ncbi:MAG: hypothetical protein KKA07_07990, partial [Bacteroidetes bacterium]|nr:hypothetical protein [Bacteroidota bacterium]
LLETFHATTPKGIPLFTTAIPVWVKEKLFMKKMLRDSLKKIGFRKIPILFPEHHLSHAASAFFPSPFEEAAILTIDGVGEWATTTICKATGNSIRILRELHFPHSIGLLYSAFTYYCGFRVNSGEYKLMGLAPYGDPDAQQTIDFKEKILQHIVDIREDGSILLNMRYFRFATGLRMTNDKKWTALFGIPPRAPESEPDQAYMNLAFAIQQVTEAIVLKLAQTARDIAGSKNLVMAGGVALNSVANGKVIEAKLFQNLWIQPAAGDAGGAVGAGLCAWHIGLGKPRIPVSPDAMKGAFLGPSFSENHTIGLMRKYDAKAVHYSSFDELCVDVAGRLDKGEIAGWFQGRMEFGPRALGNRSILGDARNPEMQKKMNLKIKFREGFRPFAPTVLEEDIQEYFDVAEPSPYMLLVVPVKENHRNALPVDYLKQPLYDRLYHLRSDIPAITHIDFSARIQSVCKKTNYRYWSLIQAFKEKTGYGILVNTSFNVRGEPIVCSPDDAYRCFMRTELDLLVIGDYVFFKKEQPDWQNNQKWKQLFDQD